MKKIYLILIGLFLFGIMIQIGSSSLSLYGTEPFTFVVQDLKLSSDLNMSKVISFCSEENCIVDEKYQRIIILSHYDNRIAIELMDMGSEDGRIELTYQIPYDINETAQRAIPRGIKISSVKWDEAIRTDLEYLIEQKILDITDEDISNILSAYNSEIPFNDSIGGWVIGEDGWIYGYNAITKGSGWYPSPSINSLGNVNVTPFPILPPKEFTLNYQKPSSVFSSWYLWAIFILIVAILTISLLKMRRN